MVSCSARFRRGADLPESNAATVKAIKEFSKRPPKRKPLPVGHYWRAVRIPKLGKVS